MKLLARLRRFARANKGLAALEFAIIAPMMIFLCFGSIEIIDMVLTDMRVQNVASSLADVVSRDTAVSNDEVTGLWTAADVLIFPNDPEEMDLRITSISIIDESTIDIIWSEGHGLPARASESEIEIPEDLMIPGTSVILAESEYDYTMPLGIVQTTAIRMGHSTFRRSRLVDPIPRVS